MDIYGNAKIEFENLKKELLSMSGKEILDRAYEYVIKEEILMIFEYKDLKFKPKIQEQIEKSNCPIDVIYQVYLDDDYYNISSCLREIIEG